jgi:Zn-dependent M28 family amino/carboxypeptidase
MSREGYARRLQNLQALLAPPLPVPAAVVGEGALPPSAGGPPRLPSPLSFEIRFKKTREWAHNVVCTIEGRDPALRREVIVVGAHYDHLGRNNRGEVFNGADDNASGCAALLGVARCLHRLKGTLRRTVVLCFFSAEEYGLVGSHSFVREFPASFPGHRMVAMINLDTIGRKKKGEIYLIGGLRSPDLKQLAEAVRSPFGTRQSPSEESRPPAKGERPPSLRLRHTIEFAFNWGSDHYPFYLAEVPSVMLCDGLPREDYHKTSDDWEKVDVEKVRAVAWLTLKMVYRLATEPIHLEKPGYVEVPYPKRRGKKGKGH